MFTEREVLFFDSEDEAGAQELILTQLGETPSKTIEVCYVLNSGPQIKPWIDDFISRVEGTVNENFIRPTATWTRGAPKFQASGNFNPGSLVLVADVTTYSGAALRETRDWHLQQGYQDQNILCYVGGFGSLDKQYDGKTVFGSVKKTLEMVNQKGPYAQDRGL